MRYEAALPNEVDRAARDHLLRHYQEGFHQEDLCLALWFPSRGYRRLTAIVNRILPPNDGEVHLHGNASFEGSYITRAVREACKHGAGLAIMHSHPSPGWQDLSGPDIAAERDYVAYVAQATGNPLLGMTIGSDGVWSARFWQSEHGRMTGIWCRKVRVPTPNQYKIYWKPTAIRKLEDRQLLRRTIETWGIDRQRNIGNLHIGVVGVGSVGALVAESLARLGIGEISLIDPDTIEVHNLDRFIYGKRHRVGEYKVYRAKREALENTTAAYALVHAIPSTVGDEDAYRRALDCDLLVSCVDRPVPRDVLNYVAMSHAIPVLEGGVAVDVDEQTGEFRSARWRSHIVVPGLACIRCAGQYNSSEVLTELDGSLDDSSYIENLPPDCRPKNQNVFPFSLGSASMQVNLMIRYLVGDDWWPTVGRQEYRFIGARTKISTHECHPYCSFRKRIGLGEQAGPSYLSRITGKQAGLTIRQRGVTAYRRLTTVLRSLRRVPAFREPAEERIER